LEIFASFAILSINSPLFMAPSSKIRTFVVYNQPVRFISHAKRAVKQLFKRKNAEMHGWRGIQRFHFEEGLTNRLWLTKLQAWHIESR